jgi:hypothetical protein
MDKTKLKLEHVSIVFANLEDGKGFGRSLTFDVTDKEIKDKVTAWVKENNIGKGDKAGKPNFKEYEGRTQFSIKISDFTQFAGLNGLTKDNLGFGAKVSIIANAFEYNNEFGKGTSSNLSAVLVESRAPTSADSDLEELLSGQIVPNEQVPEFSEADVPLTPDDFPM